MVKSEIIRNEVADQREKKYLERDYELLEKRRNQHGNLKRSCSDLPRETKKSNRIFC